MTVTTTGEVFTRRWVVDMMLDLAGYHGDVSSLRVVEPSVGSGAFFGPMVERLVASTNDWESMRSSLRGFDIIPEHVDACKRLALSLLTDAGCPIAIELVDEWLHAADFLLAEVPEADLVIGNPPYIRIENIDPQLLALYRHVCPTMSGRADLFVGFFERGLDVLAEGGRLIYICADRWMRNGYGRSLRAKVIREFSVDDIVVLHDADCFEHEVSAYPAIVNIRRSAQGPTNVAQAQDHQRITNAVDFWIETKLRQQSSSVAQGTAQGGSRAAVTGGRHLAGVNRLILDELEDLGLDDID